MNARDDDRLIDRLVDGELSDVERRALLTRLDSAPDGWRRCALAFLEAQGWREALGPLAASARPGAAGQGGGRPTTRPRVRTLSVLAAGLLAAFTLGWVARGGRPEGPAPAPLARVEAPEATAPAPTEEVPVDPPPSSEPVAVAVPAAPMPMAAGSLPTSIVPETAAPPLPEPVLKEWQRQGYEVEHRQRLISMELNDGRRLDVPVDEVRLRFVGDRTY